MSETTEREVKRQAVLYGRRDYEGRKRLHLTDDGGETTLCGRAEPGKRFLYPFGGREEVATGTYSRRYVCRTCYGRAMPKPDKPRLDDATLRRAFKEAEAAGLAAGAAARPTPMLVGQPRDLMASLTGKPDGGLDPDKPIYYVAEGVCGFAWITLYPGTSREARFAKKFYGARAAYGGGVSIWVGEFGQSLARKEAYARAFADVLRGYGIKAYAGSRLD